MVLVLLCLSFYLVVLALAWLELTMSVSRWRRVVLVILSGVLLLSACGGGSGGGGYTCPPGTHIEVKEDAGGKFSVCMPD